MELYVVIKDWGYDGSEVISIWSSYKEAIKGEKLKLFKTTKWEDEYCKSESDTNFVFLIKKYTLNQPGED